MRDQLGGASAGQSMGGASSGASAGGSGANDYWKPSAGLTWQWQLSEEVGAPLDVDV